MADHPAQPGTLAPAAQPLRQLLGSIMAAKQLAGALYEACLADAPDDETRRRQAAMAGAERAQATRIQQATRAEPLLRLDAAPPPELDAWASALMVAFALDQGATAALVGVARATDPELVSLAASLVEQEDTHQVFVLGRFAALAREDPALGWRLAREMIAARDWVKAIFPRHAALAALAESGVLGAGAARAHDAFLANLGDRIQEALGVLGEL